MRRLWVWGASISAMATLLRPASAEPPPISAPQTTFASLRVLEGDAASGTALLDELERTKRIEWTANRTTPAYVAIAQDEIVATLHVDAAPAAQVTTVMLLERMSSVDATLKRPPLVLLSARGADFKGVVSALTYKCTSQRCNVKLTLLQTPLAPPPDGAWEWGPRN